MTVPAVISPLLHKLRKNIFTTEKKCDIMYRTVPRTRTTDISTVPDLFALAGERIHNCDSPAVL